MALPRWTVNKRRITGMILAKKPGLAALASGATGAGSTTEEGSARGGSAAGAELGVRGLASGNSAVPNRLLSAALMLAAGPTAKRHVAKNKTRSERKRAIAETVKCVEIPYQRLPTGKAKAQF